MRRHLHFIRVRLFSYFYFSQPSTFKIKWRTVVFPPSAVCIADRAWTCAWGRWGGGGTVLRKSSQGLAATGHSLLSPQPHRESVTAEKCQPRFHLEILGGSIPSGRKVIPGNGKPLIPASSPIPWWKWPKTVVLHAPSLTQEQKCHPGSC